MTQCGEGVLPSPVVVSGSGMASATLEFRESGTEFRESGTEAQAKGVLTNHCVNPGKMWVDEAPGCLPKVKPNAPRPAGNALEDVQKEISREVD